MLAGGIALAASVPAPAHACSCEGRRRNLVYQCAHSEFAFAGVVESVTVRDEVYRVRFRVVREIIGIVPSPYELSMGVVEGAREVGWTSCDTRPFAVGTPVRVFLRDGSQRGLTYCDYAPVVAAEELALDPCSDESLEAERAALAERDRRWRAVSAPRAGCAVAPSAARDARPARMALSLVVALVVLSHLVVSRLVVSRLVVSRATVARARRAR